MEAINVYLPLLDIYGGGDGGGAALSEVELVKIISRNIPNAWKTRFKLANGHKSTTTTQAQKILCLLKKKISQQIEQLEKSSAIKSNTRENKVRMEHDYAPIQF